MSKALICKSQNATTQNLPCPQNETFCYILRHYVTFIKNSITQQYQRSKPIHPNKMSQNKFSHPMRHFIIKVSNHKASNSRHPKFPLYRKFSD